MSRTAPTQEEINEAVRKHLPRGWTVKWKRGRKFPGERFKDAGEYIRGVTYFDKKQILCIEPVSYENLAIFLHECGHAHIHTRDIDDIDWLAEQEYEAEQFAIKAMRAMGIPVPRSFIKRGREYIRDCVEEAPDIQHSDEVLKYAYGKEWRKHG